MNHGFDKDLFLSKLHTHIARWRSLLMLFIALLMGGCKTIEYVPVETLRTEYKDKAMEVHSIDSVIDTRLIYVKGDTVISWRDRIRWRDREIHDSIYLERIDTIRIPFPVKEIVEVERKTPWWKKSIDFLGYVSTAFLMVFMIVFIRNKRAN